MPHKKVHFRGIAHVSGLGARFNRHHVSAGSSDYLRAGILPDGAQEQGSGSQSKQAVSDVPSCIMMDFL